MTTGRAQQSLPVNPLYHCPPWILTLRKHPLVNCLQIELATMALNVFLSDRRSSLQNAGNCIIHPPSIISDSPLSPPLSTLFCGVSTYLTAVQRLQKVFLLTLQSLVHARATFNAAQSYRSRQSFMPTSQDYETFYATVEEARIALLGEVNYPFDFHHDFAVGPNFREDVMLEGCSGRAHKAFLFLVFGIYKGMDEDQNGYLTMVLSKPVDAPVFIKKMFDNQRLTMEQVAIQDSVAKGASSDLRLERGFRQLVPE
ncbi:hypothetical protein DL96DRAFT_1722847 [Flagelloscypha sp. PMI_526]|nr:hypothetical protein DL96DRAFT_1722847 [Flagelloscypha sp. PMI_526]